MTLPFFVGAAIGRPLVKFWKMRTSDACPYKVKMILPLVIDILLHYNIGNIFLKRREIT